MVQVLQFRRRFARQPGWTQQELAEFYRVESALTQAGVKLETDQGVTDEGDPWFVFCRPDSSEVIVHFARLGDEFIIDGFGYERAARGADFGALVRDLISSDLFAVAKTKPKNSNVFLHPAALLIVLVGTAFLHSGQAKAAELHEKADVRRPLGLITLLGTGASGALPADTDPVQAAALVAGAILALEQQVLGASAALAEPEEPVASKAAGLTGSEFTPPPAVTSAPVLAPVHVDALLTADIATGPAVAPAIFQAPLAAAELPASDAVVQIVLAPASAQPAAALQIGGIVIPTAPGAFDGILLLGARLAALPADEAGDLLQGVVTPDHPVLTLNGALPGVVLGLIENGLHLTAAVPPGAGAATGSVSHSLPLLGGAGSGSVNFGGGQTALPHPHDPAIDAAVAQFINGAPHWEVLTSGRDLVVYDATILAPLGAISPLDSVTFTFSDGSSVSLVGTSTELAAAHTLLHSEGLLH